MNKISSGCCLQIRFCQQENLPAITQDQTPILFIGLTILHQLHWLYSTELLVVN
jgi:hypothetical protein